MKIGVTLHSTGNQGIIGSGSGKVFAEWDMATTECEVQKVWGQICVEFTLFDWIYSRAEVRLPVEMAQQLAKVILAESEGLWEKWSTKFAAES